jgi:hypothetical protein
MKRLFLILTAFVLVFPSPNQIYSKRTISENDLRTYVCILAADSLEGRYVGTHGYNTATRYAQQEFKKAGLKTILTDGREESWFQPIILENHKLSKDSTSLTLTFGKTQKNYFGTENFCFPNLGIDNRYETSGNAVFVGYGIKEPDYGWDDYKNTCRPSPNRRRCRRSASRSRRSGCPPCATPR